MHKAKFLALCAFILILLIPSANAQSDTSLNPIGTIIGIVFGAGLIFFLVDNILSLKISNPHIIESLILIIAGAIIVVSIFSAGIANNPEQPFYHAICGNEICDAGEILDCISDCGYACGDGICNTNPPWGEWVNCPQDCDINNTELTNDLQSFFRPVVSGLQIQRGNIGGGQCTLGAVLNINGTYYGLTAAHCINSTNETILYSPSNNNGSYIIGQTIEVNTTNDVAIIRINVSANSTDFLNNTVDCVADDYINATNKVYKIGRTTGITFGRIVNETSTIFWIKPENVSLFTDFGDSGAAIVLLGRPRKLMGISSATFIDIDNVTTSISPSPQAILNSFTNISLPVCPQGIYI